MQEIIYPAPGSDKAISLGCTCPVLDNHHGRGYGANWRKYGWIMSGACPVHGRLFDYIFQYDEIPPPAHWQNTPKSGL